MASKYKSHISVQVRCAALVACLMAALCSACSAQQLPEPTKQSPISQTATEPASTPTATLPPLDGALLFEEGRYKRDEICGRIFDYTQTIYGPLTIAIAKNFAEPQDPQALATQVIERYNDLAESSPVPLDQPITIYVIPDPKQGNCYSRVRLVFSTPEDIDTRAFAEELFVAATGIREYWINTGLASLALGEQPDREKLKEWYQHTEDLDIAGLFIAWFMEDWATEEEREIARMSATSLLQYALEVENIPPDRLVEKVNNEVRTRWLASMGVDREVTYPYDGDFAGFLYSQRSDCDLSVNADTMYFCLNRIPNQQYFDEISEAEFFIYDAYYGRKALAEYLLSEAPSVNQWVNPEETISFEVKDLGGRLGYTNGNTITLNKSSVYYDILHEVVHTFEWNSSLSLDDNKIWLSEGFAEYLGTLLSIYPQTLTRRVFEDLHRLNDADTSNSPGTSYWYFLDSEQLNAAKEWYLAQGGQIENEESTDPRLYTDAVSFATMYRDVPGALGISIGEKYDLLVSGFQLKGQDGLELSYTQAASMIAWLCDTYTLDRVLNVYVNGAEDGLLDGKTYAELKAEWQAGLKSRGQGIAIPGSP